MKVKKRQGVKIFFETVAHSSCEEEIIEESPKNEKKFKQEKV